MVWSLIAIFFWSNNFLSFIESFSRLKLLVKRQQLIIFTINTWLKMYTTWCHYQLFDTRFLKLVLLLQPSKQVTVSIKTWSCGGAYSINKCVLDSFSQTLETGESRSIICWQRRWTGEVVVGAAAECQGKLAVTQSGQLEVTLPPREGGGGGLFAILWSVILFYWLLTSMYNSDGTRTVENICPKSLYLFICRVL